MIGAVAAASSFFTNLAINTSDFSHRLKKPKLQGIDSTGTTNTQKNWGLDEGHKDQAISPIWLAHMASMMATKSLKDNWQDDFDKMPDAQEIAKIHALLAAQEAEHGRAYQITSATLHYAGDVTKTYLKGNIPDIHYSSFSFPAILQFLTTKKKQSPRGSLLQRSQRLPQLPLTLHSQRAAPTPRRNRRSKQRSSRCRQSTYLHPFFHAKKRKGIVANRTFYCSATRNSD